MRIAIWHNLPSGGGKRALFHQVRGLLERGHEVEAWCPPTADRDFLPLADLVPEHAVPLATPTAPRSFAARAAAASTAMQRTIAAMREHCAACAEQMRAGGAELLLAHPCLLFRSPPIGRFFHGQRVLFLQEPFRALYEALPDPPWAARAGLSLRGRVGDALRTRAMRLQIREEVGNAAAFDRILVNSRFSRESVLRAYGLESTVCYLGVDSELFRPSESERGRYLVGLGNVDRNKGIERALAAVAALPAANRPPLVWVGNYESTGYARELRELGRSHGVRFETRISLPDAELVEVLARAVMLLYTPRLEPFGLAALEAAACGTPVVGIAEGGVRETVVDGVNGVLVDDADPAALGAAIADLLADPGRREALGRSARRHAVERWSWAASIDRLECLLGVQGTGGAARA